MKLALVANPKSGAGRSVDEIAAALRGAGHEVTAFSLDEAAEAAASEVDRVVVAGGDGSVGPVFAACAAHGVSLAVLPAGTANDFARAAGVPSDFDAAVAIAVDPQATTRAVWGATVNGRPFVNVASVGLSVHATRQAAPLKGIFGPVAYPLGALVAATKGRAVAITIDVDGTTVFAGRAWQVLVAASGAFGGIGQVPEADPTDPTISVVVWQSGSRLGLLRRVWGMRRGGDEGGVETHTGHEVQVNVSPRQSWNVDGEVVRLGSITARPLGPVSVVRGSDGDTEDAA